MFYMQVGKDTYVSSQSDPFFFGASPPLVRTLLFILSSRFTHVFIVDIATFNMS